MDRTYWHKQELGKPLFPDLLWSRPETKRARGKLLVIGGHSEGFTAPARAYSEAVNSEIGSARVLLPQHVQKLLPKSFSEMEFVPSTPSGSFGRQALAELVTGAQWADGVLLAGDFGRNSETAILLEQFIQKYQGQLTLAQDSLPYFFEQSLAVLDRKDTLIVPTFSQLQKLATGAGITKAFTSTMDLLHFIDALHVFTQTHSIALVTQHLETIFVAVNGQVSTTKSSARDKVTLAPHAAVWWLQPPTNPFEAVTLSLLN